MVLRSPLNTRAYPDATIGRSRLHGSFDELPRVHVHRNLLEFEDAAGDMLAEPAERLLALLSGGAHRVADDPVLHELVVIHREAEVLVALELRVRHPVVLAEGLRE